MRKVLIFIGSRANYGRLKSVIKAVKEHPKLKLQLVVGASALQCDIKYSPDATIQCLIDGDNVEAMAITTGVLMTQLPNIFDKLKPDIVLVHGDRYELLAVAATAAYMNIPLAHTEGGETTGTIDEKVRHMISQAADIHFPVTQDAAKKLIYMGAKQIHVVGSTALDSIANIDLTNNRNEPYIVILHHSNTTDPEDIHPLIKAINQIDLHKVWVNPNVDAGSKQILKLAHQQNVEFVKNLPPEEYARLINNCKCLAGNTSSGIKEGAFLGVPYVCIGKRQENRERGNNAIFVDYDTEKIVKAINKQVQHGKYKPDYRFGNGTAAQKIVKILLEVEL